MGRPNQSQRKLTTALICHRVEFHVEVSGGLFHLVDTPFEELIFKTSYIHSYMLGLLICSSGHSKKANF